MRRREFIGLIGAAAGLPIAVRAQEPVQRRRLGVLMAIAEDDPLRRTFLAALSDGLRRSGWVEGQNIELDYRWAGANPERIKQMAKSLAASAPVAIIAHTSPATAALMNETKTIPIVFVTVTEPLAQGFVSSLARPGGNVTGFTNFEFCMGGKWLEILRELLPEVRKAKVIFNPDTAPGGGAIFLQSIAAGAKSLAIEIAPASVRNETDIEAAIGALGQSSGVGLIVPPDIFLVVNRTKIVELAAHFRVPTIYQYDYFVRGGGLVSYGVDVPDLFRRAALYAHRLLNGESAADLPVQAPTKFQLVVNLMTAKTLGLTFPPTLLARADEVIE
jgi:putative tryptophan/tyrosine transport system substrate-binding protein